MKATSVFQASGSRRQVREDLVRKFMRRYGAGAARLRPKSRAASR
jgi:hypothetical protein